MRRCPSTTGSAGRPASGGRRRLPPRRRPACSTASSRCGSTPISAPVCPGGRARGQFDRRADRRGGDGVFTIVNQSARATLGQAAYNVAPTTVGGYFSKINCFCFTEQRLAVGEKREMAVVFFVDPALAKDSDQDDLNTITLSYTSTRCATRSVRWPTTPRCPHRGGFELQRERPARAARELRRR